MKKNNTLKRFLAFFLCAAIMITYMPNQVYTLADESENDSAAAVQEEPAPAEKKAEKPAPKKAEAQAPAEKKAEEPAPKAEEPAAEPAAPAEEPEQPKAQEPAETQEPEADKPADETAPAEDQAENPADEEKPEEDAVKDDSEVKYPKQSFSGSAGGVSVKVNAPEGALPEGTKMKVTAVSASEVMDAVESVVDGEVTRVKAVDITFVKDGTEIEPQKEVSVVLSARGIDSDADKQQVVHVDGGGNAEIVASASDSGVAKFTSDAFSYYVIVSTNENGDPDDVKIISGVTNDGIEVTITGKASQLPSDTELTVTDLSSPTKDELSDATGKNITDVQAIGMSLSNTDGGQYNISEGVNVKIEGASATGLIYVGGDYTSSVGEGSSYEYTATELSDVVFASESDEYEVRFIVEDPVEGDVEILQTFSKEGGETIGTLPEQPFKSGYRFEGWFTKGDTQVEITADTEVNGDIDAYAVFSPVDIYVATVHYYYMTPGGDKIVFDTNIEDIDGKDFPKTIESPASVAVGSVDPDYPTYYPRQTAVVITEDSFEGDSKEVELEVEYVRYTATYDYVYKVKDLTGDGYTEFARDEGIKGVMNSSVTAPAKSIDPDKAYLFDNVTF